MKKVIPMNSRTEENTYHVDPGTWDSELSGWCPPRDRSISQAVLVSLWYHWQALTPQLPVFQSIGSLHKVCRWHHFHYRLPSRVFWSAEMIHQKTKRVCCPLHGNAILKTWQRFQSIHRDLRTTSRPSDRLNDTETFIRDVMGYFEMVTTDCFKTYVHFQ